MPSHENFPHEGVLSQADMFEPLLAAAPSFEPRWEEFLADYGEEKDLPLYIALWSLAGHLVAQIKSGDTDALDAVFTVVERWHVEGDAYVREAATIGLLESLQGIVADPKMGMSQADLRRWLRPESAKWWDKLNAFWSGDTNALREDC